MCDGNVKILPLSQAQANHAPFRPRLHELGQPIGHELSDEPPVDAYALGLKHGRDAAEVAFAAEREKLQSLLAASDTMQNGSVDELAQLIAAAVCQLTCQIVATAPIDAQWLEKQACKAAAVMVDCEAARTLRLNPDDLALLDRSVLPLPVVADAMLPRGEMRIDGSAGWIEHGRSSYLDALQAALLLGDGQ